jgi:hypothetical protein
VQEEEEEEEEEEVQEVDNDASGGEREGELKSHGLKVDNDASGGEREGELKSHGLKNGIFFFLKSEWLGSNFFFKMDSIPIMKVLQPQRPSGSTAEIFII